MRNRLGVDFMRYSVFGAAFMLAACGADVPTEQLRLADQAISLAETERAERVAPAEFAVARQKRELADDAVRDGRNEAARRLAEEARVDAELAIALSDAEAARLAADELRQGNEMLRDELTSGN